VWISSTVSDANLSYSHLATSRMLREPVGVTPPPPMSIAAAGLPRYGSPP
jgi:hypothetical protein